MTSMFSLLTVPLRRFLYCWLASRLKLSTQSLRLRPLFFSDHITAKKCLRDVDLTLFQGIDLPIREVSSGYRKSEGVGRGDAWNHRRANEVCGFRKAYGALFINHTRSSHTFSQMLSPHFWYRWCCVSIFPSMLLSLASILSNGDCANTW